MTAAELYDIVKDLPGDAWPGQLAYSTHDMAWFVPSQGSVESTLAHHAVLLFEASVMRWLENQVVVTTCWARDQFWLQRGNTSEPIIKSPTKIHALAAAVRAIQENSK